MIKATFIKHEKRIRELFSEGTVFQFEDKEYITVFCDKPKRQLGKSGGEPKTDVFISAKEKDNPGNIITIKISYKKEDADFLENKLSANRAREIFGKDWKNILKNCVNTIKQNIKEKEILFFEKDGKTAKGSITLGWRFDFVNKANGNLSSQIALTDAQKIDLYAGTNLREQLKNSIVNGSIVNDSGIADYIIVKNIKEIKTAQDAIESMKKIDDYVKDEKPNIYFACKALNYLSLKCVNNDEKKYDGDRPLAVFIKWKAENGKLKSEFIFDEPLMYGGNCSFRFLKEALSQLGFSSTNDFDESILDNVKFKK